MKKIDLGDDLTMFAAAFGVAMMIVWAVMFLSGCGPGPALEEPTEGASCDKEHSMSCSSEGYKMYCVKYFAYRTDQFEVKISPRPGELTWVKYEDLPCTPK